MGTTQLSSQLISDGAVAVTKQNCLNMVSEGAEVTSVGRPFQMWAPATGKAFAPTVDR